MEEKLIFANGINLFLKEYENKSDTIVFLHCSGGTNEQWNGMIKYFKDTYRIVIPDLRGHGNSSKPKLDYYLETLAEDLKEMMDHLEIKNAHFVGSSLGGEVAVVLASIYPHLVKSLVCEGAIVNMFGPNSYYGDLTTEEIMNKKEEILDKRAKVTNPVFNNPSEMIEKYKSDYEEHGLEWNDYRLKYIESNIELTHTQNYTRKCPSRIGYELIKVYLDIQFEEYLKKIHCPILFLPSEDEYRSQIVKNTLNLHKKIIKDTEVKIIKDSVHAEVMLDKPNVLSEIILEFYKKYF